MASPPMWMPVTVNIRIDEAVDVSLPEGMRQQSCQRKVVPLRAGRGIAVNGQALQRPVDATIGDGGGISRHERPRITMRRGHGRGKNDLPVLNVEIDVGDVARIGFVTT